MGYLDFVIFLYLDNSMKLSLPNGTATMTWFQLTTEVKVNKKQLQPPFHKLSEPLKR